MSTPRLIYLSQEVLNTCNHWAAITNPNQITDALLTSTKAMLTDFSTQEDQSTTITNLREEINVALNDQDVPNATI